MNTLRYARIASGLLALAAALDLSAQVLPTPNFTTNGTYNQNFDSLTTAVGSQLTWVDGNQSSPTLDGWYVSDHTAPVRTTGIPGGSSLYLFANPVDTTDRALGSFTGGDGFGPIYYGVQLTNSTGHVLDSVSIRFDVESYRTNASGSDYTYLSYGLGNTGLLGGTWTTLAPLNAYAGAESWTLGNLTWNDGDTLWIRWEDLRLNGSANAALAIDNFSVTAIPEPSTYALILGVATLGLVGFRRWRAQR